MSNDTNSFRAPILSTANVFTNHVIWLYFSSLSLYSMPEIVYYIGVIMTTLASQITSPTVVYSTVYSDPDQRKHQSPASLAFVWGIHRDRWIPRTKGQLRGKCVHLMTSSCRIFTHTHTPNDDIRKWCCGNKSIESLLTLRCKGKIIFCRRYLKCHSLNENYWIEF